MQVEEQRVTLVQAMGAHERARRLKVDDLQAELRLAREAEAQATSRLKQCEDRHAEEIELLRTAMQHKDTEIESASLAAGERDTALHLEKQGRCSDAEMVQKLRRQLEEVKNRAAADAEAAGVAAQAKLASQSAQTARIVSKMQEEWDAERQHWQQQLGMKQADDAGALAGVRYSTQYGPSSPLRGGGYPAASNGPICTAPPSIGSTRPASRNTTLFSPIGTLNQGADRPCSRAHHYYC